VKLALRDDATRTGLTPHPAEITDVVIHCEFRFQEKPDQTGEDNFPAIDATTHPGITGSEEEQFRAGARAPA
jgi:hypothetical protein